MCFKEHKLCVYKLLTAITGSSQKAFATNYAELEWASVWEKVVWTLCCAASSDGVVQHDVAPPLLSAEEKGKD